MERGAWQATVNGVAESGTTEQLTHIIEFWRGITRISIMRECSALEKWIAGSKIW